MVKLEDVLPGGVWLLLLLASVVLLLLLTFLSHFQVDKANMTQEGNTKQNMAGKYAPMGGYKENYWTTLFAGYFQFSIFTKVAAMEGLIGGFV